MRVQCPHPTGRPGTEFMGASDIKALSPGTWVTNGDAVVHMGHAAKGLMERTGCDARVISGSTFTKWMKTLDWSEEDCQKAEEQGNKADIKASMTNFHLQNADIVFIGYVRGLHWSLLVLCHPGT